MMNRIDVSIIIPVYNVEKYIKECIESVISQDSKCAIECILVDDRGNDRSMEYAKEVTDRYNGAIEFRHITHDKNMGHSAARNSGIKEARGRYVYFLDSDDIITPDCIRSLMERANGYPKAQIITGDFQTFPEKDVYKDLSLANKNFPDYSDNRRWIRSVFLTKFPSIVCNKLIGTKFIRENNLYFKEGILHEDNCWHIQAYEKITAIGFVKKVTYLYRVRYGSTMTDPKLRRKRMESISLICGEMLSKNQKWDVGWAKCIRDMLSILRYYPSSADGGEEARTFYEKYTEIIQKKKGIPLPIKLLFKYWEKKTPESNELIFNSLFNLYWYLSDVIKLRRPLI